MSARVPRTRFAAPFVITIAGATGAVAACVVTTSAGRPADGAALDHRGGAPGSGEGGSTIVVNPPRPATGDGGGSAAGSGTGSAAGSGSGSATSPMVANPPRPATGSGSAVAAPPVTDAKPGSPPPAPISKPAAPARAWRVSKAGKGCQAVVEVECPTGAMCNPPPPVAYACPKGLSLERPAVIIQTTVAGRCSVPEQPMLVVPCPTQ